MKDVGHQAVKSRVEDIDDTGALKESLDALRSVITIFDANGRLILLSLPLMLGELAMQLCIARIFGRCCPR